MRLVKKSKYLDSHLAANAVVVSVMSDGEPKLVEKITATSSTRLLAYINSMGQYARGIGVQRNQRDSKVLLYEKKMQEKFMTDLTVEIVYYPEPGTGKLIGLAVDGLTRVTSALNQDFNGTISINVRYAKDLESVRKLVFAFDSRDSVRTADEAIRYVFGVLSKKRLSAIRKVNSAIQNIILGCPNERISEFIKSAPKFKWVRLVTYSSLAYLRDYQPEVLDWFCESFTCKGNKDPRGRLMTVGTVTAVILTRMAYGDEATRTWKAYFNGTFRHGDEELRSLRDDVMSRASRGGGQNIQKGDFHRAIYAYLSANKRCGLHLKKFIPEATYQVSKGYLGVTGVKVTKTAKKVTKKAKKVQKAA